MTATGAAPGRTPPPDEDVRAEVRDSSARTMLVEAAAGTGKTTLLVDRILGGVREGRVRLAGTVATVDFAATYLALGLGLDPSVSPHVADLRDRTA